MVLRMYLVYNTVVWLCQLFSCGGKSFIPTGKKSSSRQFCGLCCCVSFWFWWETGNFFVVAGKFNYDLKKKFSSHLSGGLCCCVSFWFWRLRPEKKVLVVCLAGCAVVSVFGSSSSHDFYVKLNVSNLNETNLY